MILSRAIIFVGLSTFRFPSISFHYIRYVSCFHSARTFLNVHLLCNGVGKQKYVRKMTDENGKQKKCSSQNISEDCSQHFSKDKSMNNDNACLDEVGNKSLLKSYIIPEDSTSQEIENAGADTIKRKRSHQSPRTSSRRKAKKKKRRHSHSPSSSSSVQSKSDDTFSEEQTSSCGTRLSQFVSQPPATATLIQPSSSSSSPIFRDSQMLASASSSSGPNVGQTNCSDVRNNREIRSDQPFLAPPSASCQGKTEYKKAKETPRCWHHVQEAAASPGSMEFTVMSYNILAQDLMERHPQLYARCKDFDLDWTNRSAALIQQILSHNADIVCLQEVQKDHWASQLKSAMTSHGYGTFFKQRKGGKSDGCAILYKKDKFGFLRFVPVDFVKGGILDRDNVGIILLLRPLKPFYNGSTDTICVATTHLLFNPKRGDIKLAQLMFLLAEIDRHAYKGMHLSSGFSKNHTSNDGMGEKLSKSNAKDINNVHNQPNTSACNYFEDCVGLRGNQHKERKDGGECCEAIGDAENRTLTSDLSTSSTTIRVKEETKSVGHEEPPASSVGINHENASRQCFKAEEVSDEHSSYNPSYCPIILCGDFNSEPFSHLHQLITRGSLRYEGLISRCISGQKEGSEGGRDIYLSKELIPSSLKVSEGCQFLWATKSRSKDCKNTQVEREAENQHLQMNTGFLYHKMNFSSVYEHFIDTRHKNVSEVSTHHLKASCTVDYIFYSSNRSRLLQSKSVYHDKPTFDTRSSCSRGARAVSSGGFTIRTSGSGGRSVVPSSSADHDVGTSSAEGHSACTSSSKCQTMDLSSSRGRHNMTSSKSAVMAPSSSPSVRPMMEQKSSNVDDNEEVEPLQLLARYRLMSTREVARTGFLPNHVLPSDHLCLIARFLLR